MNERKGVPADYSAYLEQERELQKLVSETDAEIKEGEEFIKGLEKEVLELKKMPENELLPAQVQEIQSLPERISEIRQIIVELKSVRERFITQKDKYQELHEKVRGLLEKLNFFETTQ